MKSLRTIAPVAAWFRVGQRAAASSAVDRIRTSRPAAFLSGGALGFFAGLSLAATAAYIGIYESYQKASSIVLGDMENLSSSVAKVLPSFCLHTPCCLRY